MPKFSIIVPVYNVEDYLPRCVDSILNQQYPDFELILVDDGSTDNSSIICDKYANKDNRIRVIHKENGGVSTARNIGIENASGEYITFCDSDDYYKDNLLEVAFRYLDDNSLDLLCFNYETLHNTGLKKGSNIDTGFFDLIEPTDNFSLIINHTFKSFMGWSMWANFMRLELIRKNNLMVCTHCNNYAEDIGFSLKFLLHAKTVLSISDCLYVYDQTREESMMNKSKGVFKLDDVNEVAFNVKEEFSKTFGNKYSDYYSVIYFQLMYSEYVEMIWEKRIRELPDEVVKIRKKDWYASQTKRVLKSKDRFLEYYGKAITGEYMAMARYCLTGSYRRYHLECWLNHLCNKEK